MWFAKTVQLSTGWDCSLFVKVVRPRKLERKKQKDLSDGISRAFSSETGNGQYLPEAWARQRQRLREDACIASLIARGIEFSPLACANLPFFSIF